MPSKIFGDTVPLTPLLFGVKNADSTLKMLGGIIIVVFQEMNRFAK